MMMLKDLADFLQVFGGWGVASVMLVGIVGLYRCTSKILEKRNEDFVEALRETTAMLQQNSDKLERVENLLRRVERLLE